MEINYSRLIEILEQTIDRQQKKIERYEKTLNKIMEMESPLYFRESQLETPYNYAKVALEME